MFSAKTSSPASCYGISSSGTLYQSLFVLDWFDIYFVDHWPSAAQSIKLDGERRSRVSRAQRFESSSILTIWWWATLKLIRTSIFECYCVTPEKEAHLSFPNVSVGNPGQGNNWSHAKSMSRPKYSLSWWALLAPSRIPFIWIIGTGDPARRWREWQIFL